MRKGGHLLRSSTVSSDQIEPATAEKHGTTPASNRAAPNVLVPRRRGAAGTPVAATVAAPMGSLVGVQCDIGLRDVGENGRVSNVGNCVFCPAR